MRLKIVAMERCSKKRHVSDDQSWVPGAHCILDRCVATGPKSKGAGVTIQNVEECRHVGTAEALCRLEVARACGHETRRFDVRCGRRENDSGRQSGLRGDAFGHSNMYRPRCRDGIYGWVARLPGGQAKRRSRALGMGARSVRRSGARSLARGGNNEE
jgi:hypothetical protein